MYELALVLLAAVACAYAALWLRWRRARTLLAGLPAFLNLPFFGSYFKFIGSEDAIMKSMTELSEIADEKNLPFLIWAGPVPMVFFSNLEDVKLVTNTYLEKPYYYDFFRDWMGEGIFTAPASLWKRSIKNLAGTFSTPVVDGYQEVFNAQSQIFVNKLKGEVGGGQFDVLRKYLAYTTLESIVQTALGVPRITECIVSTEFYAAFSRTMELYQERTFNLFYHPDVVYHLTPAYRELMRNITVMQKISDIIIDKRLKEWEEKESQADGQDDSEFSGIRCKPYLDMLLEMRSKNDFLTLQQIKSEIDTITFGGQETVATTLSFLFMMIGARTDVQDKLYAEIKEIFGDSMRPVQKEDQARMKYCEAVIYETLRLYPTVVAVFRHADKDLKLKSCTVPKGAHCAINIWGAGRSRRVWGPDAGEYRPERWLDSKLVNSVSSSFLAFSFGRRSCIGKKYAMAFIKTMVVYCLRELRFSSEADKMTLTMEMSVLRAVEGQMVSVERR